MTVITDEVTVGKATVRVQANGFEGFRKSLGVLSQIRVADPQVVVRDPILRIGVGP